MSDVIDRVRPQGDTVAALQIALATLAQEHAAAHQRKQEAAISRAALLVNGSAADVRSAEERARDAELDALRLDAMRPELQRLLTDAVAREESAARDAAVREAAAAIEQFNEWVGKHYSKAAATIAQGMQMEKAALDAVNRLRGVNTAPPAGLPPLAKAHVRSSVRGFGFLVRLPSAEPGAEGHWWP